MQMRQIEAFRAVMLSGGVTAAANMMRISQPSVSRLVSDLERAIGFALFERRGRHLFPTKRAEIFFDAVRQSFTGLDLLDQAARRIRAQPIGTVRVAALPALAGGILPEAIKRFQAKYPDHKITVEAYNQSGVEDRVFIGQADLGLGVNAARRYGLRTTTLADAEYICALPPGHRLARKKAIMAADLEGECMIGPMHEADALWDAIDRMLETEKVTVRRLVEAQMSFPAYCYVAAGLGLTIAEPFSAPLFARSGVVLRRFQPMIHSTFTLIEAAATAVEQPAVVDFKAFIHQECDRVLQEVQRLCLLRTKV